MDISHFIYSSVDEYPSCFIFFLSIMDKVSMNIQVQIFRCIPRSEITESYGNSIFKFFVCFFFVGQHLQHMEIPHLGIKSEL